LIDNFSRHFIPENRGKMHLFLTVLGLLVVLLSVGIAIYLLTARPYRSSNSVATSYDEWTEDGILEFYWGEHIHLGYYGSPPQQKDFLAAKADFVHEMVRWGGLDKLPTGTTVLDVGCGIGGSSRILARDYGFAVTGITISPEQVNRATELTPQDINAQFQVDDAIAHTKVKVKLSKFSSIVYFFSLIHLIASSDLEAKFHDRLFWLFSDKLSDTII
jgi:SAM-dependent methyltransferase